jgi:hypothetical protein
MSLTAPDSPDRLDALVYAITHPAACVPDRILCAADNSRGAHMRHRFAGLVLAGTALALTGCGGDADQPPDAAATSTTNAAPTTSTAPSDPYDAYTNTVTGLGLTPGVKREESVSVAGNICDNTVADMAGLIANLESIYDTPEKMAAFLTDRAHFIDAYCPDARVVFDPGSQQAAGVSVPR